MSNEPSNIIFDRADADGMRVRVYDFVTSYNVILHSVDAPEDGGAERIVGGRIFPKGGKADRRAEAIAYAETLVTQ